MSCTIFYKGKLKKKHSPSELFEIIIKEVTVHNWKYLVNENCLTINFDKSISEPLVLKFINHEVSGFCKVLSHDKETVEKIFKIFFRVRKMFFRLSINDDFDMWLDYIAKMEPCKIVLRELTKKEMNFITKYDEKLSSTNVLHNIIADDLKNSGININGKNDLYNKINPNIPTYLLNTTFAMLENWIYETMEYKNYGKIRDIKDKPKGLVNDMLSFSFGISECLLYSYGGSVGRKQAQIRKLYMQEIYNKKIDIQTNHIIMYRFILSVLEYLGIKRT